MNTTATIRKLFTIESATLVNLICFCFLVSVLWEWASHPWVLTGTLMAHDSLTKVHRRHGNDRLCEVRHVFHAGLFN